MRKKTKNHIKLIDKPISPSECYAVVEKLWSKRTTMNDISAVCWVCKVRFVCWTEYSIQTREEWIEKILSFLSYEKNHPYLFDKKNIIKGKTNTKERTKLMCRHYNLWNRYRNSVGRKFYINIFIVQWLCFGSMHQIPSNIILNLGILIFLYIYVSTAIHQFFFEQW